MVPGKRPLLLTALVLVACGENRATHAEIDRILQQIRSEDRVESTSAAISCRHLVRRQSRFSLLDRPQLRWWQERLRPVVPVLVEMLADERGLEWVDGQGNTEQVTTPRREARLTLVALGRASIDGLITALDRPELSRKANEVLREIVGSGPAEGSRASWERFWAERRNEGLQDEQGSLGYVLLGLLVLAAAVTTFIWFQIRRHRALEDKRPRLAVPPSGPTPAASAPRVEPTSSPPGSAEPPAQNLKT